ncbi:hypothetical protein HZA26_01485 [Candidatus Nomurabacteria bacterium]|nr:hypothetical protein [Candidatus Nomurabacteria bacterium]
MVDHTLNTGLEATMLTNRTFAHVLLVLVFLFFVVSTLLRGQGQIVLEDWKKVNLLPLASVGFDAKVQGEGGEPCGEYFHYDGKPVTTTDPPSITFALPFYTEDRAKMNGRLGTPVSTRVGGGSPEVHISLEVKKPELRVALSKPNEPPPMIEIWVSPGEFAKASCLIYMSKIVRH